VALLAAILVPFALLRGGTGTSQEDIDPTFSLAGADGQQVALAQLFQEHEAVVVVFYRGFF
jgi:peroxiredoxin